MNAPRAEQKQTKNAPDISFQPLSMVVSDVVTDRDHIDVLSDLCFIFYLLSIFVFS